MTTKTKRRPQHVTDQLILKYVARCIEKQGYQPSFREIAKYLGVSSIGNVQQSIARSQQAGILHASEAKSRCLRFAKPHHWRDYL